MPGYLSYSVTTWKCVIGPILMSTSTLNHRLMNTTLLLCPHWYPSACRSWCAKPSNRIITVTHHAFRAGSISGRCWLDLANVAQERWPQCYQHLAMPHTSSLYMVANHWPVTAWISTDHNNDFDINELPKIMSNRFVDRCSGVTGNDNNTILKSQCGQTMTAANHCYIKKD